MAHLLITKKNFVILGLKMWSGGGTSQSPWGKLFGGLLRILHYSEQRHKRPKRQSFLILCNYQWFEYSV